MLEDSEVFCFSCKTNPLYTPCTASFSLQEHLLWGYLQRHIAALLDRIKLLLDFQHSMMHSWTWSQNGIVEQVAQHSPLWMFFCHKMSNIFPFLVDFKRLQQTINKPLPLPLPCASVKCALGSGRSAKVTTGRCPAQRFKMSAATLRIRSSQNFLRHTLFMPSSLQP